MKIQIYSKKKLIWLYKDLAQRLGKQPTKKQWSEDANTPSDMPIRMRFGCWQNFVKICGDVPYKPHISGLARKNTILAHKGKRSFSWKGGRVTDKFGYVQIWKPEHPNAKLAGYIHEHRLVMSEYLGRPLYKFENVHHKNGKRDDNRIENLELWTTMQPTGQRVSDLVEYAHKILDIYENPELSHGI